MGPMDAKKVAEDCKVFNEAITNAMKSVELPQSVYMVVGELLPTILSNRSLVIEASHRHYDITRTLEKAPDREVNPVQPPIFEQVYADMVLGICFWVAQGYVKMANEVKDK